MDPALEAHRRHLAALRDAAAHRPEAHGHQLAALDRLLALVEHHDDLLAFRSSSGDGFELARAIRLDQVANQARVAALVGEPLAAQAAALEYGELVEARGHADWPERIGAANARAAPLRENASAAGVLFTRLLLAGLGVKAAATEGEAALWRESADSAYRALLDADPAFGGGDLEATTRYALRVPWTGSGRALVAGWLPPGQARESGALAAAGRVIEAGRRSWHDGLAQVSQVEVIAEEVTIEAVAAPYRALAEAVVGDDRAAAAVRDAARAAVREALGADSGHEAAARLASGGRLTELVAAPQRVRAQDALERQAIWPDPLVAHHWHSLLHGLEGARTPTEVELVLAHAEACFAIERDWNALMLETLLGPLRAAFAGQAGPAGALTEQLTGVGGHRLLALPRVRAHLDAVLEPLAMRPPGALGAFEGEAGFELVVAARTHLVEGGDPDLRAVLRDRLGAGGEAPARPFALWRVGVDPGDLEKALTRPCRPRL